jgi:hypothetical protein
MDLAPISKLQYFIFHLLASYPGNKEAHQRSQSSCHPENEVYPMMG